MIHFGVRSDFDNIDNEALDFEQLEAFIQSNGVVHSPTQSAQTTLDNSQQINQATNLPESPPDSGSEPPYSPNIKVNQSIPIDHLHTMNTLTELHVPHHHHLHSHHLNHHHHNILSNQSEIYLSPEQQQLIQINSMLHKHENPLLQSTQQSQDQMLLYQVSQSGQILELNQIHQQQQPMSNRLYKNDMIEIDGTVQLPAMHGIQSPLNTALNENLTIIGGGENFQRNITTTTTNSDHLAADQVVLTHVKKRKGERGDNAKTYKSSDSKKNYHNSKNKKKQLIHHPIAESSNNNDEITDDKKRDHKIPSDHFNDSANNENKNMNNFTSTTSSNAADNVMSKDNESGSDGSQIQCIRFSSFQQQQWHTLLDHNHQELPIPHFRVDADKGFNFSNSDDSFVCQKKNHFQITCHVQLHGNGVYVKTQNSIEKVRTFHLHFYGVKLEAPAQTIRIEQSQSDRSKKPFYPVLIDLQNGQVSKVTVGRLHFSETTCNNMRKKGRPNPEQRYFQLVVGLHAHTYTGYFPIISHASERIIVRASNPGQFEGDVDLCCWQRGITQNSIFHQGKIGINTDMPDESLVVNGNMKVTGHIIQPSDARIKYNISELDTSQQLDNVNQIRIVRYRYESAFAENNQLDNTTYQTGIIAQELQKILPDAIHNGGNVKLADGTNVDNFLQVNKDRVFMESIGAVKQLTKITDDLERRLENLENRQSSGLFDKIKFFQFIIIVMVFLSALWY